MSALLSVWLPLLLPICGGRILRKHRCDAVRDQRTPRISRSRRDVVERGSRVEEENDATHQAKTGVTRQPERKRHPSCGTKHDLGAPGRNRTASITRSTTTLGARQCLPSRHCRALDTAAGTDPGV